MAKMLVSRIVHFEWETPEEEAIAKTFTPANKCYLINLRAKCMEERLKLRMNTANVYLFLQDEAALTAQIELLDTILSES